MRNITILMTAAATLALVAGCIVSDQITTITVQPDGSADWVKFQSNIRSTEKGAKGAEELRKFVEEFDAHKDSDYIHITESGGDVVEARWVRNEEPYANLVTARFPKWTALENFCTIKDDKGTVIARPQFTQNGTRRRLSLMIPVPKDEKPTETPDLTIEKLRQDQANGISETRIVIAGGQIIAFHGFTVAGDKRSALLEPAKLEELFDTTEGHVELFLEWEVAGQ